MPLTINDIKNSHRLGPRRQNQRNTRATKTVPRAIIFRLATTRKRREIFVNKKKLKNTGITITENLTRIRYDIYKKALTKFGKGFVWTNQGKIVVNANNAKHTITTLDELNDLTSVETLVQPQL